MLKSCNFSLKQDMYKGNIHHKHLTSIAVLATGADPGLLWGGGGSHLSGRGENSQGEKRWCILFFEY